MAFKDKMTRFVDETASKTKELIDTSSEKMSSVSEKVDKVSSIAKEKIETRSLVSVYLQGMDAQSTELIMPDVKVKGLVIDHQTVMDEQGNLYNAFTTTPQFFKRLSDKNAVFLGSELLRLAYGHSFDLYGELRYDRKNNLGYMIQLIKAPVDLMPFIEKIEIPLFSGDVMVFTPSEKTVGIIHIHINPRGSSEEPKMISITENNEDQHEDEDSYLEDRTAYQEEESQYNEYEQHHQDHNHEQHHQDHNHEQHHQDHNHEQHHQDHNHEQHNGDWR